MPKVGRRTGPSKADGTQVQPSRQLGGIDLEVLGPNADVTIGGELTVQGVSMTPTALEDLPEVSTPLDGTETVAVDQDGVAVRATASQLAGGPLETQFGMERTRLRYVDDLDTFSAATTTDATLIAGTRLRTALSGTGAQVAQGQGVGEFGIADLTTGTTTTGRCAIVPFYSMLFLWDAALRRFGARVKMPAVSDGTNTYRVTMGMGDMTSSNPADAILFRSPTAAGNWEALIRDDSADLASIDTGVAVDSAGAFHDFLVEYDPGFSGVRWYIDGTLVASDTVNEPDALANMSTWGVSIIKSAGTTSRICEVDVVSWDMPSGRTTIHLP